METILREVLAEDKSLLCRRDELIVALEKKIPPNKSRDFASIKRALSFNVGEKFFVGEDADREATKAEVAKILKEGGLQEARVNFVVETFVKALDWDKPITPTLEKKSDTAKSVAFPSVAEVFKKAKAEQKVSTTTPQKTNQQPTPKPTAPQQQSPPKPSTPPQQSATAPSNKNNQSATTLSTNQKNLFIGALCFLMLMLFFAAGKGSNPSTSTTPPPASSASNAQQTETTQNLSPSPPPEDTSYLNAQTDLSLNGIDLGASVEQLVLSWGEPNQRERRDDGNFTYAYDTINVGIVDGKVHSFMTRDPKFKTLRGLRVGSTYSEVIDKYGTDSMNMNNGNLVLYEYPFTSLDGKHSLLRFAVDGNERVEYISIRILEEEAPKKKDNSGIDENTKQAATAFLRFHEAITDKNYSAAFNIFSDERKENMNYDVQAFAKGYSNTITSEITDLNLVSTSDNRVVMNYILDARDRAGGGRTLYQQFSGQVEMLKIGGEWKIAATQSKRIKEVMER